MPTLSINPEQPHQLQEIPHTSFDLKQSLYRALDQLILYKHQHPQSLITGSEIIDYIEMSPTDYIIKTFLFYLSVQYLAQKGEEFLADNLFDMGERLYIDTFQNPILCYYILKGYLQCDNPIISDSAINNFISHNHFILNEILAIADQYGPPGLAEKLRDYQYQQ